MNRTMKTFSCAAVAIALVLAVSPVTEAAKKTNDEAAQLAQLKEDVAELKKAPDNMELREKIIKQSQSMKKSPPVPEEYERLMSRGFAFLKLANDVDGFNKAISEFKAAIALAPWKADAYVNLADGQEKAGLFAEAIVNLKFAILAEPNAKDERELRNKIYELEVFAEDAKQALKASPSVPAPPPPAPPVVAKKAPAKKPIPAAKKTDPKVFVGNWYYKDTGPRGGDLTTHAFTITMGDKGDLAAQAPRRSTGATGSVTLFEVSDDGVHVQITWKLANVPSYSKTEDYDVTLTSNDTKMAGPLKVKSSGRDFAQDVVLFKQ
jgi:tetratricopeptide (TPR) repeat protein